MYGIVFLLTHPGILSHYIIHLYLSPQMKMNISTTGLPNKKHVYFGWARPTHPPITHKTVSSQGPRKKVDYVTTIEITTCFSKTGCNHDKHKNRLRFIYYVHSESVLTIVCCVRRYWWKFYVTTAHVQYDIVYYSHWQNSRGIIFFPKLPFKLIMLVQLLMSPLQFLLWFPSGM